MTKRTFQAAKYSVTTIEDVSKHVGLSVAQTKRLLRDAIYKMRKNEKLAEMWKDN